VTAELVAIIAPIFLGAAIGFAWVRLGLAFEAGSIAALVTNLAAPCLIFATLSTLPLDPWRFGRFLLLALGCLVVLLALGAAVLRLLRLPLTTYLPPLTFPNNGNMGLPLSLFAFGEQGLALAIAFFAVMAIIHFTVGIWILSGTGSIGGLLRNPIVWSVPAGGAFLLAGQPPPLWLHRTAEMIGEATVPLMLLMLGASLARLRATRLWRSGGLGALRLVLGLAVGLATARLLGLDGVERGVVLIQCAMPVAVFSYPLALRYDRAPDEVAGMVLVSTLLSFATLPLLLLLARG
jgi:hypothetical protein